MCWLEIVYGVDPARELEEQNVTGSPLIDRQYNRDMYTSTLGTP